MAFPSGSLLALPFRVTATLELTFWVLPALATGARLAAGVWVTVGLDAGVLLAVGVAGAPPVQAVNITVAASANGDRYRL